MTPETLALAERLERHPKLKARMSSLLDLAELKGDTTHNAHSAEAVVIEELRKMGNDTLTDWAKQSSRSVEEQASGDPEVSKHGKKNLVALDLRSDRD
jgi:hypothetical protein